MIQRISFRRFKSFLEGSLPLSPLTLMIGANASGKSNAIEAVRFLSWLARGRRLDDIMAAVQEDDPLVRGTIEDLSYGSESTFELSCRAEGEWNRFSITIEVEAEGMRIVDEEIVSPSTTVPLYKVAAPADQYSHEIQVEYNNFARGGRKPKIPCTDQQAVFTQLATPARFSQAKSQRVIPRVVESYRRFLADILFLDPSPRRMRGYSFRNERSLKGDGSNLSSVLFALSRNGDKERILDFIRALPEQDIRDIDFVKTPRSEVMVQLIEAFAGHKRPCDASLLSDGTLRVLAVAAALLSAPEESLVIIEEIDNGVHPSRAKMLLDNIKQVAEERRLKVLLSTHNPALLDNLPAESVPDVVCCYRDPESGASRTIRLEELRDYPELVARGPLGQLMSRGVIESFLKDQRSAEEKKRASLRWLNALAAAG